MKADCKRIISTMLVVFFGLHGSATSAAAIYAFNEIGGDVIGELSGSLDFTGMTGVSGASAGSPAIWASSGLFSSATTGTPQLQYEVTGPGAFGTGGGVLADSASGPSIFAQSVFLIDTSYNSGSPMVGEMTFLDTTLDELGITPGSYVYTFTNEETFTLTFNESNISPVPIPAAAWLFGSALLGLGMVKRRSF